MANRGKAAISDAMKAIIYRRHKKDGLTSREIAELTGVSAGACSKIIREMKEKEAANG